MTLSSSHRWALGGFVAAIACAVIAAPRVWSQGSAAPTTSVNGRDAAAGDVIVKFKTEPGPTRRGQLEAQLGATASEPIAAGTRRLHSDTYDVNTLVAYLRTQPDVAFAEPNYIL